MYQEIIAKTLRNLIMEEATLIIIPIVVLIMIISLIIKKGLPKEFLLIAIGFIILSYTLVGYRVIPFVNDINNERFIEYVGEFDIKNDGNQDLVKDKITLLNKNNTVVKTYLPHSIDSGIYKGKIVYTEKSKIIVHWEFHP